MALFIYDPNVRVVTPLSVDLKRRTISELSETAPIARIHAELPKPGDIPPILPNPYQQAAQRQPDSRGSQSQPCAADIMTPHVVTISEQANWQEARQLMQQHGIHHLLVVDDQRRLLGLLAERDLLVFPDQAAQIDLEVLPIRPLTTASPETTLSVIAFVMLERQLDAVAVISGTTTVGILTQKDLLKFFNHHAQIEDWV